MKTSSLLWLTTLTFSTALSACQKPFNVSSSFAVSGGVSPGLPQPTLPPVPSATPSPPALPSRDKLAVGTHHVCALDHEGFAYCWGRASSGQIAQSNLTNLSRAKRISETLQFKIIRAGTHNTCGLTFSNELYCWGQNIYGSLGIGDEIQKNVPTKMPDLPDKIRDFALSAPFNKFTEHIRLNVDPRFGCALLANGSVYCWGDNRLGSIGQPSSLAKSSIPLQVSGISNATTLAVGAAHACVITNPDGILKCWGDNHADQMSGAISASATFSPVTIGSAGEFVEVRAGGANTCALNSTRNIRCWGFNYAGNLGRGTSTAKEATRISPIGLNSTSIKEFEVGLDNICVITEVGKLLCWGDNYAGQMALGTSGSNTGKSSPFEISNVVGPSSSIGVGTFSMCTHSSNNDLYCWGHAYFGESGNGIMYGANVVSPNRVLDYQW